MSKIGMLTNVFAQLRRLWDEIRRHDRRLENIGWYANQLDRRISELEEVAHTPSRAEYEHHPATRPVTKKTPEPPDFTPEEMGYEPCEMMAPNKHTCPCCGGPITIEGDGSTHWYKPAPEANTAPSETPRQKLSEAVLHALLRYNGSEKEWPYSATIDFLITTAKVLEVEQCFAQAQILREIADILDASKAGAE